MAAVLSVFSGLRQCGSGEKRGGETVGRRGARGPVIRLEDHPGSPVAADLRDLAVSDTHLRRRICAARDQVNGVDPLRLRRSERCSGRFTVAADVLGYIVHGCADADGGNDWMSSFIER